MEKRRFLQSCAIAALSSPAGYVLSQTKVENKQYNLQGKDLEGKKINIADMSDKVLLVSFFSLENPAVMRDLKLMREFYSGNMMRKYMQLAVSVDQNRRELDTYNDMVLKSIPIEQRFPILHRYSAEHKDNFGNMLKVPTHFALDKNQQLVFKREGLFRGEDWNNLWEAIDA